MLRQPFALVAILTALTVAGCTNTSGNSGSECSGPGDCDAGETCVDGYCRLLCNSDVDCPGPRESCDGGVCIPPFSTDCDLDADCRSPGTCETSVNAVCLGGGCVYARLPCDMPDADECFAGDGWYRAFGAPGTCGPPSDRCEYEVFEYACADCAATCLVDCAALDCHDDGGGCRKDGHCNPGPPAGCVYTNVADGTACSLPSDPAGVQNGLCSDGDCRSSASYCSGPSDCGASESCIGSRCLLNDGQNCTSNDACANACISGLCAPRSSPGGDCDAPDDSDDCGAGMSCRTGTCYVDTGGTCSDNDDCVETCIGGGCAALSGNAGPCDALDDLDCISAHECSDGICRRMDGQSCTTNDECAGTCVGNQCVSLVAPGGTCDDTPDCEPSTVTVTCDVGTCVLDNDGDCTANNQCANTCIGGTCAGTSAVLGACDTSPSDDTDDCSGALVCESGTCRKALGTICASDAECVDPGECECGDAACSSTARVCAANDCDCKYGTDGACSLNLNVGIDDPEDCDTTGLSCYQGGCRADNQGTCACPIPDPITTCTTCGNSSTCPGRTASSNSCGTGWGPVCPSCTASTVCTYGCFCSCTASCACTNPL